MKKFSSLLVVLLLMSVSFIAHAQGYPRGDVDRDGAVNISDVTCLIDNLLAGVPEGDVDQDGAVNISDVTSLIDYLLSGSWPDDPVTPPDDGDWVDLGLPSGTIWATRNVGANSPEDCGYYFAWGETEPKSYYDWRSYKWYRDGFYDTNGNWHNPGYTKYCTRSSDGYDGFTDGKTQLDPEDDAACAHYPGGRMPSGEQIEELCLKCSWRWIQHNSINGYLVTGPNGNTMFLPAAGNRLDGLLYDANLCGWYWSRTLYLGYSYSAYFMFFNSDRWGNSYGSVRFCGKTVRAVHVSQN